MARFADVGGEFVDRHLAVHQCPQHLDAGGVGEHPEHLDDQTYLIIGQPAPTSTRICIHTQIIVAAYPQVRWDSAA